MSLEELQARQAKVAKAAADLEKVKDDPAALLEKAAQIAEMTKDLERAALGLVKGLAPEGGAEERVVLTPDQRERIAESTGVAMEVLVVRDGDGSFARAMPGMQKAIIERLAARQATESATKKAKRDAIEKLIKQLKSLNVDGLAPIIKSIEDDPSLEDLQEKMKEFAADEKAKHGGG
jgi:hypothetical protein